MFLTRPTGGLQTLVAAGALIASIGSIAFVWGYQILTGNLPCELCLLQRIPYYLGIPVAAVALAVAAKRGPAPISRGLLVIFGLAMLVGMVIAAYHAGVEWHFWAGPDACTGPVDGPAVQASDLLAKLSAPNTTPVIRCDEPYFRIFGLSFAGLNVLASIFLAAFAFFGAAGRGRTL
ncbi:disulfide bond formation protein B [Rhodobium gokarnense]|uniref:Disulfide bond formation protein DsbB n=1 Tax=Rhodobium gokarnense TaxID=364296 RepID=A0ABT3HDS1_9HYPH|nr:disulfide bond formation protein B [Rhodobium gokarnense]MCW2308533.1 disulfide bond formation protein DsbB [Rhodobium gokarnense]